MGGHPGGDAACFDARTAKLEAVGLPRPDVVTGNVVVTSLGTFATGYSIAGGASGIVKVTPPAVCNAEDDAPPSCEHRSPHKSATARSRTHVMTKFG